MFVVRGWRRCFALRLGARRTHRDLLPFVAVVACALLPLHGALLPEIAPGPFDVPQGVRDRAALLWILCWLPAAHYALLSRERRAPIPFLPIIGVLYALYYALAPMSGATNLWGSVADLSVPPIDPVHELGPAVDYALWGWITSIVGYSAVGLFGPPDLRGVRRTIGELHVGTVRRWAARFLVAGLTLTLMRRLADVPIALAGFATFLRMLSFAGLVILVAFERRHLLDGRWRAGVAVLAAATIFVELGGGATANVIYAVFCIFIGLWISGRRIPAWYYVAAVVAIAGFITVRGAMSEWRRRVWYSGEEQGPVARSALMAEIITRDVERRGALAVVASGWRLVAHRSAHSDLLADVMRRTPGSVPYWDGYTYRSLVGAVVPRVLWPDKPQKTLGQEFGHRYSYLTPSDRHTSINLPILVEMYVNFGKEGIVIGMFLVGVLYRLLARVCNQPGQGMVLSAAGVQLFVPLFVMECDFSLTFGGTIMQLAALGGVLYLLRLLQEIRHPRLTPLVPMLASIPADLPVPIGGRALRVYRTMASRVATVAPIRRWSSAQDVAAD